MDKYSGCESVLAEFMQICEGAGKQPFGNFCQKLVKTMCKEISLNTKKAFRWLFVLSIKTLTDLWNALFSELHFPAIKVVHVAMQSVNRQIFNLVLLYYKSAGQECQPAPKRRVAMGCEEENALRYASGYVAMKTMKEF